jgi:hypothetical protein
LREVIAQVYEMVVDPAFCQPMLFAEAVQRLVHHRTPQNVERTKGERLENGLQNTKPF